ncbi:MAG: hypothetical protein JHC76_12095 [Akkermansiaceae bacterium]|nr:hypothetical protein [Akkermansiaceae bacterium]
MSLCASPARVSAGMAVAMPYLFSINNQKPSIGNHQFFLRHADGDKWADRGGSALPFSFITERDGTNDCTFCNVL